MEGSPGVIRSGCFLPEFDDVALHVEGDGRNPLGIVNEPFTHNVCQKEK